MKQKVSLVLSGGGARGIAHIGVIEELEKMGFEIICVTGTSMGALVGGVYALGKMKEFSEWLITLDKKKVFSLVDFTLSSQGLIKGDKVFNTMKLLIRDENIENLKIDYAAVATDLINRKEVVFRKGSIYDAIRASIAIPTLFTPVKRDNGLLVDGGVLNNIPISHAKRVPEDILIAVNVNAAVPVIQKKKSKTENEKQDTAYQNKITEFYHQLWKNNPLDHEEKLGYFDLISKTINLMTNQIALMEMEKNSPDILINISHDSCNTYDFYKAAELIEIGKIATQQAMEAKKDLWK